VVAFVENQEIEPGRDIMEWIEMYGVVIREGDGAVQLFVEI
jgi:hypothetical protein